MFKNKRYLTRGVNQTIPISLQIIIWQMIDTMKVSKKDYLQVFRLSEKRDENGILWQQIIHTQEIPKYENQMIICCEFEPIHNEKIFVIDDGQVSTMLLAEEY